VPSDEHEGGVTLLQDLAVLTGFYYNAQHEWASGMPDVCRVSMPSGDLFLGDAKASESAGCTETAIRLRRYLDGAHRYLWNTRRSLLFALCVRFGTNPIAWVRTLEEVANEAGVDFSAVKWQNIGSGYQVIYFFGHAAVQRAEATSHLWAVSALR
jgi:hypothetical protein